MEGNRKISSLFDASGNMTPDAMQRYLDGSLGRKEKEVIEQHLESSPFDREALEGLKKHQNLDIEDDLLSLQDRLVLAVKDKQESPASGPSRRFYWAAAAGIAGLIGLTVFMVFMFRSPDSSQLTGDSRQLAVDSTQLAVDSQQYIIGGIAMADEKAITTSPAPSVTEAPVSVTRPPAKPPEPVYDIAVDADAVAEEIVAPAEYDSESTGEMQQMVMPEEEGIRDDYAGFQPDGKKGREMEPVTLHEEVVTAKRTGSSRKSKGDELEVRGMQAAAYPQEDTTKKLADENMIFVVVEKMPEYPGGDTALFRYLNENIHYPDAAKERGMQGRVFVSFVVEKDGSVTDVKVIRGIGGGCDEEALRVVQNMPRWIPGMQRGKPVRVRYNLPIKFTLGK